MAEHDTELALDERLRILRSTIGLLIRRGVPAVTPQAICAGAGVEREHYDAAFGSVSDVYVAIVASLLDDHVGNSEGTVRDNRTLIESLQLAMRAVWGLVESRIDVHHAIYVMTMAQAGNPDLIDEMGFSIHETHLRVAEAWLSEIETVFPVRWELPIDQLGLLMQATLDGLILDFLSRRDSNDVRQALDIFAAQLTMHAGSASTSPS